MARLVKSILYWSKSLPYQVIRNHHLRPAVEHFISFAELHRRNQKNIRSSSAIIATLHHLDKRRKHKKLSGSFEMLDKICVVSKEWKKHLVEIEDVPENKIHVIYNGFIGEHCFLDEDRVPLPMKVLSQDQKMELRRELGIPENSFVIGHIGRDYCWRKDSKTYYSALSAFGKDIFPIFFDDSSFPIGIKNLSAIGFHRFRDIYNVMDLYVVSSVVEGGPLGYIEAIACGTPVISTKVGMAADFHPSQYLCDVGCGEQLQERIIFVKENYDLVVSKTAEIKSDLRWLTWEWVANQYYRLYADACTDRLGNNINFQ